ERLDPDFLTLAAPIQDDFSFRLSAGVTIGWNSPFGPIRFDIAEVFIREFYDEVEAFRFSAGTNF
ncbi:MAG: BamA/TamA family outer membrane protein, partial [Pseudomonadota bacterium]